MRITSGGDVLVKKTTADDSTNVGFALYSTGLCASTVDTAGSANSYVFYNKNATNNGYRFYVKVDGGVVNYSGNNVNLSDERTKTNITLAGNYLQKICSIPVKLFNYKDEKEGEQKTLGVVAQDVEAIAPELVSNEGFGNSFEDGTPLKTIFTTDMMYAMMKSIQELNAKVDAQAVRIAELEGAK
jgi:hypothetical protein